jgi:hypothetical protein
MVHPLIKSIFLNSKRNLLVLFIALVIRFFLYKIHFSFLNSLDNCQNDLPMLELTSRSGVISKIDLIKNPSKTNEIHFEQDNLLPGKYSGYFHILKINFSSLFLLFSFINKI